MNTSQDWRAIRRGPGVLISGLVSVPRNVLPFLQRTPAARPDTRAFVLKWTPDRPRDPMALITTRFEHFEPEIPDHVRRLRIMLPDATEVLIESRRPLDT